MEEQIGILKEVRKLDIMLLPAEQPEDLHLEIMITLYYNNPPNEQCLNISEKFLQKR